MKKKTNKYAFLQKNFRNLLAEHKVVLGVHIATLIFCFFPWFSAEPIVLGADGFGYNGFQGESYLIGYLIFLLSLSVVIFWIDKLFDRNKIELPFSKNYAFFALGIQELLLAIVAWSVLSVVGQPLPNFELRFGLSGILLAQIIGLVATFLAIQKDKKSKVKAFFQHPDGPKEHHADAEE